MWYQSWTEEEFELWLRQSYYPYFYVNDVKEIDFLHIDIEAARYDWDEDTIQDIKDNLANSWGIEDRKSLIKTTDSLLEKGDKYTYARTLFMLLDIYAAISHMMST